GVLGAVGNATGSAPHAASESSTHASAPQLTACRAIRDLLLIPTLEVSRVLRISRSLVVRVLRIRTQRTTAARECASGRGHRVRWRALLHPVNDGGEEIERIELGWSTLTVTHSRRQEQSA